LQFFHFLRTIACFDCGISNCGVQFSWTTLYMFIHIVGTVSRCRRSWRILYVPQNFDFEMAPASRPISSTKNPKSQDTPPPQHMTSEWSESEYAKLAELLETFPVEKNKNRYNIPKISEKLNRSQADVLAKIGHLKKLQAAKH